MILLDALSIALAAFALYQLNELRKQTNARLTRLETRQPGKVEPKAAPVQAITSTTLYPPIENFTPKKPETLRPNQVRGREVDQNVFEFDSKL